MHVLFVIKGLGVGGAERFLLHAVRWLRAQSVLVTVANVDPNLRPLATQFEMLGAKVEHFNIFSWQAPIEFYRLLQLIAGKEVTLIHAHLPLAGFIARLAGVLARRSVIYTEHSLVNRYKLATRFLNKLSYFAPGDNIAVSEAVRDSITEAHGAKVGRRIRVILNPIGEFDWRTLRETAQKARVELDIPQGCLAIGSVASLRLAKRHDLLLEAYASVRRDIPNSLLLLIGAGPELHRLQELARTLGIEGSTKFLGLRSDPTRCSAALDIFVLCSDWEGLPLALLDAMATECAIVATRVGGVPEVLQNGVTGILVEPGRSDQIAHALRALGTDVHRRQQLGKAAAQVARERHDLNKIMSQYAALYFGPCWPLHKQSGTVAR